MSLPLPSASFPEGLLEPLLAISLTGVNLLRPLYDLTGLLDDFAIEYLNPAAQRMTGLPERPGGTIRSRFPETFSNGVFACYRRVFETGEASRYDLNYQADGFDNYFHVAACRSGEWLMVSFTDTGDQTRTPVETALRESQAAERAARQQVEQLNQELEARVEERTRSLHQAQAEVLAAARQQVQQRETLYQVFAQTPAMIQLLRGPNHHVEYVNPAYQRLFPGRTLVGFDLTEAVPELREQGFIALLDDLYQTGRTHFGLEVPLLIDQPDGQPPRTGYFTFTYQPYREKGQIAGISLFAHEVSEQVWARLERETQQARLREVFEQAPVAIFVLQGPAYVIEVVNPTMAELLGRPPAELLGRPYFEVVPELAGQGYRDLLDEVWRTGVPHFSQEREGHLPYHGPGEVGYFNFVYQPVRDIQGQVTGIACVTTDVTEQVQARQRVQDLNEELAAINEELQATNEELGDSNQQLTRVNVDLDNFIYTASHDLKAPISNLEGLLYLLQAELPAPVAQSEVVAPTLTLMLDAVERFKRTIDHLTEVSKLQKEHTPTLAAVDLAAVVEDVRLDLAPLLRDTNAQLTVAVADFPAILFSEKNLRSVVYNLLSNALKYRHPDRRPHIDVQAHVQGDFTVLEVHDNGLGLTSQHLAKLFTMFQRFHTHVEGTGIGLFMVKRMVENAGGHIEVHSQLEAGTTFFIYLPHSPGSSAA